MKPAPKVGTRRTDYIDAAELVAAVRNPKAHDLEGIMGAIAELGFMDQPMVDERTGRLIAGHGRLEALSKMRDDPAYKVPDGIREVKGAWLVPVTRGWASESDLQAEAALLTVNRLGERSGWDHVELAAVLADLAEYDEDLIRLAGWSEQEQAEALAALDPYTSPHGQTPPDDWPDHSAGVPADYLCPRCGHEWNGDPRP